MSTRKSFTTENGKEVTYDELLFDMIKQYPVKRTPSDLLVQINQNGKKKNMSIGSEEFRFYVLKTFTVVLPQVMLSKTLSIIKKPKLLKRKLPTQRYE